MHTMRHANDVISGQWGTQNIFLSIVCVDKFTLCGKFTKDYPKICISQDVRLKNLTAWHIVPPGMNTVKHLPPLLICKMA